MIKDIHLSLMIGPGVPVPVSREVVEALDSVQVNEESGDTQSGFELNFNVDKRSPLTTLFLLSGGATIPIVRVVLVVTIGGKATPLIDGVITHHQLQPGSDGGPSTLRIQGKDLSQLLDLIPFDGIPYPATPPFMRVNLILLKYSALGIIPKVVPSIMVDTPLPMSRIPRHKGKDLGYVKQLAKEAGYVFYMEPGPAPATSIAYWGPEIRVGEPQPALNIDMDAHTNVESMSFSFDKESKELPIVFIQNKETKAAIPIPLPSLTPLSPPLGAVAPLPPKLQALDDTAHLEPHVAVMRGLAYAAQHADAVFGNGSLNVLRYGHILKPRRLVGVRGAGVPFNGLYFVTKVTHNIKRGEYKQDFSLARNGLVSTVPRVRA